MTYVDRAMARHTPLEADCGSTCEAATEQPGQTARDAGDGGAAVGTPAPASPDPWAHLRGLSPLEQWNEDANR